MTAKDKTADLRRVRTPPFRMSFPHLLEPRVDDQTGRTTFQLSMLFPPNTQFDPFRLALRMAMVEKFGEDEKKWPHCKRLPRDVIRDFHQYNEEAKKPLDGDWRGWTLVRANCPDKYPPNVVGPVRGTDGFFPRISDPREVYGGRWACAVIEAYHFPGAKNNGVTFGLKNVQLLKHDAPFGITQSRPEDDFDDAPDEWSGVTEVFEHGKAREDASATSGW